jgi:hypothetical protein
MEEREPLTQCWSMKWLNINSAYDPVNSTPRLYSRELEMCPHKDMHTNVHGISCWKKSKCEWSPARQSRTMNYWYNATTWVSLKMLSKWKKPSTKTTYDATPFTWNNQKRQIYRDRKQSMTVQGWGLEDTNNKWAWGNFLGWQKCFETRSCRWLHNLKLY